MVTGTAGLEDDRAALLLLEERDYFLSPQLTLQLRLAGSIDGMNLKHGFGGVEPDHGNAHRGRLLLQVSTTRTFGT
jgi:hypothetical protein